MSELKHYGVKGMKWGVRKSEYKAMNRQQRRETKKKYYNTPEGKVARAAEIGTFLLGPVGGIIAGSVVAVKQGSKLKPSQVSKNKKTSGSLSNKKINEIPENITNKGKNKVDQYKNTKIETDEQKIIRLIEDGQISPKAHHYFDQNGNLFMVTWDD